MNSSKRKRTLAVATMMLALLALSAPRQCQSPNFKEIAQPLSKSQQALVLPLIKLPKRDQQNGVEALFVDSSGLHHGKGWVTWTVVFVDEDHPIVGIDQLYDAYRWFFAWKRVADIEVIRARLSAPQRVEELEFPGTYAGDQDFSGLFPQHLTKLCPRESLSFEGSRPIVSVQTWNHMFSERDRGQKAGWLTLHEVPCYSGSRQFVEKSFRELWRD